MKSICVLSLFVLFIGLSSCEDECNCAGQGEFEYMLFGHFYGYCQGENCIEIFKIEDGKLYEDISDAYPNDHEPYQGDFVPLPSDKYELVKDLMQDFPDELYSETAHTIGMPDAGDWGGVYVEVKHRDAPALSGYWLLDQFDDNMPEVYNVFVDRINEKIHLIHQ